MSAIQGFQLSQGGDIEKYDYNALDNKLELDTTLQISGQAADAAIVGNNFGNLTNLKTINKNNLVEAINENVDNLEILTTAKGDLSELETTSTHSLVAAINEVNNKAGNLEELNTEVNGNLVDAINEINNKTYGDLESKPSINNQILNSGNNTLSELGIPSLENVYLKTDLIELTGVVTDVESNSKKSAYKEFRNLQNCEDLVVISISEKITATNGTTIIYNYGSFYKDEVTNGVYPRADLYLQTGPSSSLQITLYNPSAETVNITYRVILLKISSINE